MKFYLIEQLLTICSNNNKISKHVKYTLPVIFCTHYSLFYFGRAESCKHKQLAFGWKDCLMYQICYQLLLFFMCLKSHFVPGWCDIGHYWRQWGDRRSRSGGPVTRIMMAVLAKLWMKVLLLLLSLSSVSRGELRLAMAVPDTTL